MATCNTKTVFGVGSIWAIPTGENPTPLRLAELTEISFDFSVSQKELYGDKDFPIDIRQGQKKLTGKAKQAIVDTEAMQVLIHGGERTAGYDATAEFEAGTLVLSSVTVANSADFKVDLGVIYKATGKRLKRVDILVTPALGEYSVDTATGEYTFSAADQTAQTTLGATPLVAISYGYFVATGGTYTVKSQQIGGASMNFEVRVQDNNGSVYRFLNCSATKTGLGFKTEDFVQPDFEFMVKACCTGEVWSVGGANL